VSRRCWTLDPSDLAYWEACPRCFYLKVVLGFPRPGPRVPEIVARLEERMKAGWQGGRTETLAPEMPAGVFERCEGRVESEPVDVHLPDAVRRCRIRGGPDTFVRLDSGGYAVVDVGVGERHAVQDALEARRLHAYAYALEHAAPGALALSPVTRLGLLVFEPETLARNDDGMATLAGGLTWIEVPRDDGQLFGFLAEVLSVLEQPEPPGGAPLCDWCVYRDASRRTGL